MTVLTQPTPIDPRELLQLQGIAVKYAVAFTADEARALTRLRRERREGQR